MRSLSLIALLAATPVLAEPVTVLDQLGREVAFDRPPAKVLCLGPDCIQHMAVIGEVPAMAFEYDVTSSTDPAILGERAAQMDSFTWGGDGPDMEKLLAFAPDLVVMDDWSGTGASMAVLREAAPYIVTVGPYPDYSDLDLTAEGGWGAYTADLMNIAAIMGKPDVAQAFAARLQDRYAAYQALAPGGTTYARIRLETDNTILAMPCAPLLDGLGECIGYGDWTTMMPEGLLADDPQVLYVEESPDRTIDLEAWNDVPLWAELSAVREGRVHVIGYGSIYDSTPLALSNALDAIVPALYPEAFDGPLTDAEVAAALN
ncbi:MAG: ABC transporter substrate-binding protein [Pseudomonadota bacterium]